MGRRVYIDNRPLDEAWEEFRSRLAARGFFAVDSEVVPVETSVGRVTARPVLARKSSPHYSASAMDGIAVRAADTFGASDTSPVRLQEGSQYVEVDTGDAVPPQFDAVVMIEEVDFPVAGVAELRAPATPWQHVRSVGEDVIATQMLLGSLQPIRSFELGAFLTAGVTSVEVVRRPRVGIIPTGTELVEPGAAGLEPGQITESNSRMLAAMCAGWGALPVRYPIEVDDRERIETALRRAVTENDIVVVCSGSSAGREDYTAETVARLGEIVQHGIATRPGKPAILGIIDGKAVVGVPGYPVSAALVADLFLRPLVYGKQGLEPPPRPELKARLARKTASPMGVDEFVQVSVAKVGECLRAYPLSRGAGITSSLVKADGVLRIPRGTEGYEAGEEVTVVMLRPAHQVERTVVSIGSHDLALDWLGDAMFRQSGLRLVSTNAGSLGGLAALRRGEAHLAGVHLLDPATGDYNISYVRRYLRGVPIRLVNLVTRQQGLLVRHGNPADIRGLADLVRPGIRFINRQQGAGTRILLDHLLRREGIDSGAIHGYGREEYSHLAVAAAVLNGAADVGMGICAAARALGLDFVPLAEERYDLCLRTDLVPAEMERALARALESGAFRGRVEEYGGYGLELSGQLMWESE